MRLGRNIALTDTGRKRRRNEDSYVVRPPLFAVADGMGGAQAGEIASRIAIEAMGEPGTGGGEDRVTALIQEANRRIYARSHDDATVSGMGTTMTAALVADDGHVAIGHVGDSRAYLLRDGKLEQLTQDHSLVAELVRTGKLSAEEAESHPQRSVITRALGTDPDVDVDSFTIPAQPGDLFLLCSDGLTTMLGDDEIRRTVEDTADLEEAARALIGKANKLGGEDNITLVFFEIAEGEPTHDGATVEIPAASLRSDPEDDDTLDEIDRIPAVDTMVVSADQVEAAYERDRSRRRHDPRLDRTAKRVLSILAVLALVAVAVAVLLWGLFY